MKALKSRLNIKKRKIEIFFFFEALTSVSNEFNGFLTSVTFPIFFFFDSCFGRKLIIYHDSFLLLKFELCGQ